MGHYHLALGNYLETLGHNVIYAFCDKLPVYIDQLDLTGKKCYFFSHYFKEHYTETTFPEKYRHINLNKCFFSDYDRLIVFAHEQYQGDEYYVTLMSNLINFFDKIINENNIDICLNESIANSFSYVAYEVIKNNGAQYCGYAGCRLKGRFELYTEEFGSKDYFVEKFRNVSISDIPEDILKKIDTYLLRYKSSTSLPTYHPQNTVLDWNFPIFKKLFDNKTINRIIGTFRFLRYERGYVKYSYMSRHLLRSLFIGFNNQIKRRIIAFRAKKYFEKKITSESYFLYPQHFKPEASTSVLARHYCNDLTVIENIAFNLPYGTKLYVKEHFVNYGRMPINYYRHLKQIPNVRLIRCDENTKKIIAGSLGVITLTSTVGFEALLMNKPIWVFGNVFYECHPNCHKVNNYEELFSLLNNRHILPDTENINRKFVYAYYLSSYEGNLYYMLGQKGYSDDDFVKPYVKAIHDRFKK